MRSVSSEISSLFQRSKTSSRNLQKELHPHEHKKSKRKTEKPKKVQRQDRYDDHEMAKRSMIMKWD